MHIQQTIQTMFDTIESAKQLVALCRQREPLGNPQIADQVVAAAAKLDDQITICLSALTTGQAPVKSSPIESMSTEAVPDSVADAAEAGSAATAASFDPTPKPMGRKVSKMAGASAQAARPPRKAVEAQIAAPVTPAPTERKPVKRRNKPLDIVTFPSQRATSPPPASRAKPAKPAKPGGKLATTTEVAKAAMPKSAPEIKVTASKLKRGASIPVMPVEVVAAPLGKAKGKGRSKTV